MINLFIAAAPVEPRSAFALPGIFWLILVIIALVIALIAVGSMRAKLKTAKMQVSASNYIRENSFELRVRQDRFLYRTVSRRKIEQRKN